MGGDGAAVARGFDRSAAEYDEILVRNRHGARRLVEALPEEELPRVLDVGCGTGFVSEEMVARRGARALTGVDPSEAMLAEEAAAHGERVAGAVRAAAGPRGFEYTFVKLYGVARRPS